MSEGTRQSRFIRAPKRQSIVLTARDIAILMAVWLYRWLTSAQLRRLLPASPCVARFNIILRRLFDAGYLHRVRAGTVGAGLTPVYTLGRAAAPLISDQSGLLPGEVRRRIAEDASASESLLPHDLLANDVMIGLVLGVRSCAEGRLDLCLNARDAYDRYEKHHALRPDGFLRFTIGSVLYNCYVEVDRGSVPLTRWAAKVRGYVEYGQSGSFERRFGLRRFRVLVAAPSPERLAHLMEATRSVTAASFWFAHTADLIPVAQLNRAVWQTLSQEGRRPLVEERPNR